MFDLPVQFLRLEVDRHALCVDRHRQIPEWTPRSRVGPLTADPVAADTFIPSTQRAVNDTAEGQRQPVAANAPGLSQSQIELVMERAVGTRAVGEDDGLYFRRCRSDDAGWRRGPDRAGRRGPGGRSPDVHGGVVSIVPLVSPLSRSMRAENFVPGREHVGRAGRLDDEWRRSSGVVDDRELHVAHFQQGERRADACGSSSVTVRASFRTIQGHGVRGGRCRTGCRAVRIGSSVRLVRGRCAGQARLEQFDLVRTLEAVAAEDAVPCRGKWTPDGA